MEIETSHGFTVRVRDDAEEYLNDMETFEKLVAIDKGDLHPLPEIVIGLFGEDGRKDLYAKMREKTGHARTWDVVKIISELLPKIGETAKK